MNDDEAETSTDKTTRISNHITESIKAGPSDYSHRRLLLKALDSIILYSLFLEKTVKPRSDDGFPSYEIPLTSLSNEGTMYSSLDIAKHLVFFIAPKLFLRRNFNVYDREFLSGHEGTNDCVVIELRGFEGQRITVSAIKEKLMEIKRKFKSGLDQFINSYDDDWVHHIATETEPHLPIVHNSESKEFNPPEFISQLKRLPFYSNQIEQGGSFVVPMRPHSYLDVQTPLPDVIIDALCQYWGISKKDLHLYKHQALALDYINSGYSVIVATDTSSGKSLIYQIPVLNSLYQHLNHHLKLPPTAFFLFPTKALAQDQLRSFRQLSHLIFGENYPTSNTYDGDTDPSEKAKMRQTSQVLFSNPDTIHVDILPKWFQWESFLKSLRYIIIDEIHVYTGIFGINVSYILRRLKRICNELGNTTIQVICCSATVNNADRLLKTMFCLDDSEIKVLDSSLNGAPSGDRHWVVWNSPKINGTEGPYCRAHPIHDGTVIFAELLARNVRTLAFCKTRQECELLIRSIKAELDSRGLSHLKSKVMSYRGGYSSSDRREIEYKMATGSYTGLVSTSALELGIDIGEMDVILHLGFPYHISSLRQQSGRAGRRGRPSLSLLIGGNGPIDQYYMENPRAILSEKNADVGIALDSDEILNAHLQCASYEMPISTESDGKYFEAHNTPESFFEKSVKKYLVPVRDGEFLFYGPSQKYMPFPASLFSIRSGLAGNDDTSFVVICGNRILENIEIERVPFTLYEGGIFLSQGNMYLIERLDIKLRIAQALEVKVNYITKTRDFTDVDPYLSVQSRNLGKASKCVLGLVNLSTTVFGFYKKGKGKNGGYSRIIESVAISEPNRNLFSLQCQGLWIPLPPKLMITIADKKLSVAAAIHAAEHAILSLVPIHISRFCDESTIGTECKAPEKEFKSGKHQRKRPAQLIFFESNTNVSKGSNIGGSLEIMSKLFEKMEVILNQARHRVENCKCVWGCPDCVASTQCREKAIVISKPGAILILRYLSAVPLDEKTVLDGPEKNLEHNGGGQTILYAIN